MYLPARISDDRSSFRRLLSSFHQKVINKWAWFWGWFWIFTDSKKIETVQDSHQNVPKTKVTLNVTPRGGSEVFSASTRSKKYSLFVIWHHRECDSPPSTSLFLTLPYTSFMFPSESLSAKRKPKEGARKSAAGGGESHYRWCQITNN